jgi:hypothetical protein
MNGKSCMHWRYNVADFVVSGWMVNKSVTLTRFQSNVHDTSVLKKVALVLD